jgi:hypothetical protein
MKLAALIRKGALSKPPTVQTGRESTGSVAEVANVAVASHQIDESDSRLRATAGSPESDKRFAGSNQSVVGSSSLESNSGLSNTDGRGNAGGFATATIATVATLPTFEDRCNPETDRGLLLPKNTGDRGDSLTEGPI